MLDSIRRISHVISISLVTLFTFSSFARTQEVSDTDVTRPGNVRIEIGGTYAHNDDGGSETDTWQGPATLLRTGITEHLEARLEWSGIQQVETHTNGDDHDRGALDAAVSAKYLLTEETSSAPRTAVLAGTTLPVGEADFSSERFDPQVLGIASKSLSERISMEAHAGVAWATSESATGDRDTLASFTYATTAYYSFNESWSTFVELFGSVPINDSGGPSNSADVGVIHVINEHVELDAWIGRGLSDDADDVFTSVNVVLTF